MTNAMNKVQTLNEIDVPIGEHLILLAREIPPVRIKFDRVSEYDSIKDREIARHYGFANLRFSRQEGFVILPSWRYFGLNESLKKKIGQGFPLNHEEIHSVAEYLDYGEEKR